jgi:hypothetical protein
MSLDTAKLENVRQRGGRIVAACPACREAGADRSGEHLVILDGGKWGCIAFAGPSGHDHRRRIAELVGDEHRDRSGYRPAPRPAPPKPVCKPARPLPELRALSAERLRQIATDRGWHTDAGLEVLVERGLLLVGEIYDDGTTHHAWIATDPSRANAQARKFDRGVWHGIGGSKAKSLSGTTASRCIGASVIGERPTVWLMEGTPDLCAAPIVARLAGLDLDQLAFVCITGAGNALHPQDLRHFIGKRIVIAVHSDGAGAGAGARWASQLYHAGAASVEAFKFAEGVKDLAEHLERLAPATPAPTPAPAGLCPACWSRGIAAPTGGPTCTCSTFNWPTWTPAQLAADARDTHPMAAGSELAAP